MNQAAGAAGSLHLFGGAAHVVLTHALDGQHAAGATALLERALTSGMSLVVVDLTLVPSCDEQGRALLVRAHERLHGDGGHLFVTGAPATLRRLLGAAGLDSALSTAPYSTPVPSLTADLVAAAQVPLVRAVLDAALDLVTVMSQAVMAGADGVSITVPRDGALCTVAASDDVVRQMDQDQYDTGQGPCLDAAVHGQPFSSTDLASEHRWPDFVPRARRRGIESIMSTPLTAGDVPLGALNVYSRAADALSSHEQQWATQFALQASSVLLAGGTTTTEASVQADISAALASREVIALAQGAIMTRQQVQPDVAFRFLTDISRRTSRPLVQICEDVVRASAPGTRAGRP